MPLWCRGHSFIVALYLRRCCMLYISFKLKVERVRLVTDLRQPVPRTTTDETGSGYAQLINEKAC